LNHIMTLLSTKRTKRANFLSVGVTLCSLIAAICAAPLAFVNTWIAVWLLGLMTILILGTFSIWAFYAIKHPHLLNTEDHAEQMAAISMLGANRPGQEALVEMITGQPVLENPQLSMDEPK
jgi:fatty acid desaturase